MAVITVKCQQCLYPKGVLLGIEEIPDHLRTYHPDTIHASFMIEHDPGQPSVAELEELYGNEVIPTVEELMEVSIE